MRGAKKGKISEIKESKKDLRVRSSLNAKYFQKRKNENAKK